MDLRLFGSVLWRYRVVVAIGSLLAVSIALMTTYRVVLDGGAPKLEYRSPEVWQSSSLILLTQRGFPWGRSTLNDVVAIQRSGSAPGKTEFAPRFADTPRYQGLAVIYAHLAASDEVRQAMLERGPIEGEYGAEAVRASDGASFLPMIEIKAYSYSPTAATALAARATQAFRSYLGEHQSESDVPLSQRVEIPVVNEPRKATLFQGRSMSRPLFVFILTISLVIGLAFLLENLNPRSRSGPAQRRPAVTEADGPELVDWERPAA